MMKLEKKTLEEWTTWAEDIDLDDYDGSQWDKQLISVESMKEELNNLRTDVKCYLEDEEEIDSRIVNNVKAMFAKLYLKL